MTSAMDMLTGIQNKPYLGFASLAPGNYEIKKFRIVKNKLFKADAEKPALKMTLLVELEDQVLFMPEYISCNFVENEAKVAELNSDGMKKFLFFGGKRGNR